VYCPEMSLGLTTQEEALDATSPAAAVQTVTVREVPLAKGTGAGGAVPQPIRPMQAAAEEGATPGPASGSESIPQVPATTSAPVLSPPLETATDEAQSPIPASPTESEAQPATRTRRGTPRGRRTVAAADEPVTSVADPVLQPSEPVTAGGDGSESGPFTQETPQLEANQELFPTGSSPSSTPSRDEAQMATPVAEAVAVTAEPEPLEPTDHGDRQPSAAEVVQSGLQEIPRIASLQALDGAKARVNALLASGRINEEGAERLWAVIDRRRNELQAVTEAAVEATP